MDFSGARIALYGRFLQLPREDAVRQILERGGVAERDLTRRTNLLVIGFGSRNLIPSGHLSRKTRQATQQGAKAIGETRLWAALNGASETAPTYPIDRIAPQPDAALLDLLNAFDIIEFDGNFCRFGDVATLRAATDLMEDGHELSSVVRILLRAKAVSPEGPHRTVAVDGKARLKWGDAETELDGQGILALPEEPTLDDVFEHAMLAEAEGDLDAAERGYSICMQMDKTDPIAPFNLGNVYTALNRPSDAARHFGYAINRDRQFVEAYFNKACQLELVGNDQGAEENLEVALQLDEHYPDALFNLAQLKQKRGEPTVAVSLLNRFLALHPEEEWAEVAIKAKKVASASISSE